MEYFLIIHYLAFEHLSLNILKSLINKNFLILVKEFDLNSLR